MNDMDTATESTNEAPREIVWPQNLLVVDAETSGLKSSDCQLVEITLLHPRSGMQGNWWFSEESDRTFEPGALRVNGLTLGALRSDRRQPAGMVLAEMYRWVRELVPEHAFAAVLWCGRNPQFDLRFLRKTARRWLRGAELGFFEQMLGHRTLDTHSLVFALAIAHGWSANPERIDDLYARIGVAKEANPHSAERGAHHATDGLERAIRAIRDGGVRA